ncbi:MAG: hypothetical protein AAFN10_13835 [Bacteroidota bacterium]
MDEDTESPMLAATARLYSLPDSVLRAGLLTDGEGRCSFQGIPQGEYLLVLSYIGFENLFQPVLVGSLNQYYDLGKLMLKASAKQLDEVLIEGQQGTVATSMDKKSFNIDDNISQSGSSALDAMRSLPGITVDAEGKIVLRGSDQVAILIDGKPIESNGFWQSARLRQSPRCQYRTNRNYQQSFG